MKYVSVIYGKCKNQKGECMRYTRLGNTDIEISKLCIGCMSFGKARTMHDWTLDETESEKIIKHALELGINFFRHSKLLFVRNE